MQRLPLAASFEHLLFSCFLKSAKPDPACFRAALAALDTGPGDVVFLDDRADNVAAAAALGIRGARFTGARQARADLDRHGSARLTRSSPAGPPASGVPLAAAETFSVGS